MLRIKPFVQFFAKQFSTTSTLLRPMCRIETNVENLNSKFTDNFTDLVAETLNKPKEFVTVSVKTNCDIKKGNDAAPIVFAQIWSIGVFDAEKCPNYSKVFIEHLAEATGVPTSRIILGLHPIEKHEAGHLLYK